MSVRGSPDHLQAKQWGHFPKIIPPTNAEKNPQRSNKGLTINEAHCSSMVMVGYAPACGRRNPIVESSEHLHINTKVVSTISRGMPISAAAELSLLEKKNNLLDRWKRFKIWSRKETLAELIPEPSSTKVNGIFRTK
ncbi:hypothetical protein NPIL_392401 [Nephila pilipes]|uniref:Uncharacterized protein n=1 Tax=Nephila pilipes TaxID=299642 RepID=A0A8X6N8P6_NEPPI|nr:hypothetical protein NPIL_392401 [Nephila pilipes]